MKNAIDEGATQVIRKGVLESTLKTQGTVSNCIAFVGKTAKTKTSVTALLETWVTI